MQQTSNKQVTKATNNIIQKATKTTKVKVAGK